MEDIGIIGCGFVGDTMHYGLKHFGFDSIKLYDPYKLPDSSIMDVTDCYMVFICVPTPMQEDGCIDDSIVLKTLCNLDEENYQGLVVIKSTLLPTSVTDFINKFANLKIATNPEFLTQRSAREDFVNSQWVIIGADGADGKLLTDLYGSMFPLARTEVVSPEAAMMMKYMCNNWFAVKVSLMNEFYELWQEIGNDDWDDVIRAFSKDTRVGPTHLQVPGPDGKRGFGGACFPKDLNALMYLMKSNGIRPRILQAAWEDNTDYRK